MYWSLSKTYYLGWRCFLGDTPTDRVRDDDLQDDLNCEYSMWLIMGYVAATFCVVGSINIVLQQSSRIVSRAVSAAIFTAFLFLWAYDVNRHENSAYILGGSVGLADVAAIIVLIVGMEVYSRDPEPDVELITNYSSPSSSKQQEEVEEHQFMSISELRSKNNGNLKVGGIGNAGNGGA